MRWEKVTWRSKNRQERASLALQPGLISLHADPMATQEQFLSLSSLSHSQLLWCLSNRSKCPSVPAVSDFFLLFISQQHSSASLNYLSWGSFPYLKKNCSYEKSKLITEKLDNIKKLSSYLSRKKLTIWYNIFLENIHVHRNYLSTNWNIYRYNFVTTILNTQIWGNFISCHNNFLYLEILNLF